MTTEELRQMLLKPGPASLKSNLALARELLHGLTEEPMNESKKRIRQPTKPKLNKLEQEALAWLKSIHQDWQLRHHTLKLELASGCWYTPDIVGMAPWNKIYAFECKGEHAWDDAIVKLKVAAREWPSIQFTLIWKEKGAWMGQMILP